MSIAFGLSSSTGSLIMPKPNFFSGLNCILLPSSCCPSGSCPSYLPLDDGWLLLYTSAIIRVLISSSFENKHLYYSIHMQMLDIKHGGVVRPRRAIKQLNILSWAAQHLLHAVLCISPDATRSLLFTAYYCFSPSLTASAPSR